MIDLIKAYEATKTKQHPVGMTVSWPGGKNSDVFASPADWISPNREGGYDESPPAPHGRQVILSDTDHIWGKGGDRGWVWKTFLRGLNPIFMDSYDQSSAYPPDIAAVRPRREDIRRNMGYTLTYANRVELSRMAPHGELASSGYCLADPTGAHPAFLVYLPSGTGNVDLRGVTADFAGEWLDPKTGVVTKTGLTGGGAVRSFKAPSAGDAVLYLAAHPDAP